MVVSTEEEIMYYTVTRSNILLVSFLDQYHISNLIFASYISFINCILTLQNYRVIHFCPYCHDDLYVNLLACYSIFSYFGATFADVYLCLE